MTGDEMGRLHDVLKRPTVAAIVRDRVSALFKDGGDITDEFLDALAAELDGLKEWKNPHLEAIDGKVYRALLGGAAAILWALLQNGIHIGGPKTLHPSKTTR
jgi:hypothetical protein